jgi:hypothetical protein
MMKESYIQILIEAKIRSETARGADVIEIRAKSGLKSR